MIDLLHPDGHNKSMQTLIITIILSLSFTSCSSYHSAPDVTSKPSSNIKTNKGSRKKSTTSSSTKSNPIRRPLAVWEFLLEGDIQLQFKNVDNDSNLTIIIHEGLTKRFVPVGHWELKGFIRSDKSFISLNTSKKFVMRVPKNKNVYAGSIIVECPKVTSEKMGLIKSMKFFNRYPFSSSKGLCEIIVGDNYNKVQSKLKNTKKINRLNLIMGF
jgi:hypothetical protein